MGHERFTRLVAVAAIIAALSPATAVAAPLGPDQTITSGSTGTSRAAESGTDTGSTGQGKDDGKTDGSTTDPGLGGDPVIPEGATVTARWKKSDYAMEQDDKGVWRASATAVTEKDWEELPVVTWSIGQGKDHKTGTVGVKPGATSLDTKQSDTLGVKQVSGAKTYTGETSGKQKVEFTAALSYKTGTEQKAGWERGKQTVSLTRGENGVWTGVLPTDGLHTNNSVYHDKATVGDQEFTAEWSDPTITTSDKGLRIWKRTMNAKGRVGDQDVVLTGDAIRLYDAHVSLSVTRTDAKGNTQLIEVPGTKLEDPSGLQDEYTLDAQSWDHVSDQFTLGGEQGPDSSVDKPTYGLGSGAERVITQTVHWTDASGAAQSKTVTIRIPFDRSTIAPDSAAKLTGIYVNRSGEKTKGALIDGWDPDILKYVVQVGENDPSPYILPEGGENVTITAGDVIQTAYTATQTWTVTVKNGKDTRSYEVSVIRAHETPTADEAFTPAEAKPETPSVDAPDPSDTSLVSWGYRDSAGEYHPVKDTEFQIPEGGEIAWEAKNMQTVTNSVEKTAPMRYTHLLGVLAPDGLTFKPMELKVTYITKATTTAALTGLTVNGTKVPGFQPEKTDYRVEVDDPTSWTLVPQYDKQLGMAISTHKDEKDKTKASVTVTSADGINTRTYTVTAVKKQPKANTPGATNGQQGNGANGAADGRLAQTGVTAWLFALVGAPMMLAGIAGPLLRRRHDND